MCSDKKCQENTNRWPVNPQMDVQLKKPAKKSIGLSKEKNCQTKICENTD